MKDKYTAVWVSHSSISDYLTCPRAYYLNNVYKDPKTGNKISIISPPLALGQVVHNAIESLSVLPVEKRFDESLMSRYEAAWKQVSGKKGGFKNDEQERTYKKRGQAMIDRVQKNPGPLKNLAVKITMELPYFWLSEEDNLILCGRIDWLEYLPDEDEVRIIDFKTGRHEEDADSLQLPIYYLLVENCQSHPVAGASYWYLDWSDEPTEVELPNSDEARKRVMEVAKKIKLARQLERFTCEHDGCRACEPLERVVRGEAEYVGVSDIGQDMYVVDRDGDEEDRSVVL